MELLIVFILLAAAFGGGYKTHARKSVDYKKRWELASKLLDEEKAKTLSDGLGETQVAELRAKIKKELESGKTTVLTPAMTEDPKYVRTDQNTKVVIDARGKQHVSRSSIKQNDLWYKSNSTRYEIEKERLANGLPPFDDLANMSNQYIEALTKQRLKKGWV